MIDKVVNRIFEFQWKYVLKDTAIIYTNPRTASYVYGDSLDVVITQECPCDGKGLYYGIMRPICTAKKTI